MWADLPDIEQDLVLDLLQRLPRFDPEKSELDHFIACIVKRAVATLVVARKAGVRDYRREAGSLDKRVQDDDGNWSEGPPVLNDDTGCRQQIFEEEWACNESRGLAWDLEAATETLPDELRDLCKRLRVSTVSEISSETGTPRGTIYESMKRCRNHFERAGLAVYIDAGPDTSRTAPVGTSVGGHPAQRRDQERQT